MQPLPARRHAPIVTNQTGKRRISIDIDKGLYAEFDWVCEGYGLSPGTLARLMFEEVIRRRALMEQLAEEVLSS